MPIAVPWTADVVTTGSAAAASQTVTIPAVAHEFSYCAGFQVDGLGATGSSIIQVTLGDGVWTLTYELPIVAGATTQIANRLQYAFVHPLRATAINTAITLTVPSFGAGNTSAVCAIWGFQSL